MFSSSSASRRDDTLITRDSGGLASNSMRKAFIRTLASRLFCVNTLKVIFWT